jgi:hypothetical protein
MSEKWTTEVLCDVLEASGLLTPESSIVKERPTLSMLRSCPPRVGDMRPMDRMRDVDRCFRLQASMEKAPENLESVRVL